MNILGRQFLLGIRPYTVVQGAGGIKVWKRRWRIGKGFIN